MDLEVRKIFCELFFFLFLAGISEAWRFYLKRNKSDAVSLHFWLICSLVLCWYSSSVSLVLYNKWWVSHTPVHATIFFSTLHMFMKGVLSWGFLICGSQQALPRVSRKVALMATLVGVCTGMDITASNLSFGYVTASFYTMLKTSSLLFILVFLMSPASTLSVLPLALAREGEEIRKLDDVRKLAEFGLLALLPGILAFVLVLVEVQLVKETKALTLSVFGNLKSIVTIVFAIVVFGDRTTWIQWCGVAVALSGIFVFSGYKREPVECRDKPLLSSEAIAPADDSAYCGHEERPCMLSASFREPATESVCSAGVLPNIFR